MGVPSPRRFILFYGASVDDPSGSPRGLYRLRFLPLGSDSLTTNLGPVPTTLRTARFRVIRPRYLLRLVSPILFDVLPSCIRPIFPDLFKPILCILSYVCCDYVPRQDGDFSGVGAIHRLHQARGRRGQRVGASSNLFFVEYDPRRKFELVCIPGTDVGLFIRTPAESGLHFRIVSF